MEEIFSCERDNIIDRSPDLVKEKGDQEKARATTMTSAEEMDRAEYERLRELSIERAEQYRQVMERIRDYDPKQGGVYYNRFHLIQDNASFDLDEESPIPPMRFTDAVYKNRGNELCDALNILSVKIGLLDIEFPIHVYGTVIARDCTDIKCVYLFRRDREDSQTINSKEESLILTGPKRGLVLLSLAYIETNLIIKGDDGQEDRELSKGCLIIPGTEGRAMEKCELESHSLSTRLSTVDVMCGIVKDAVEATISIEVLAGDFCGEITACTSSIEERFVLHDRSAGIASDARIIPLLRSVVAVSVEEELLLTIAFHTEDGEFTECIEYTPWVNGSDLFEVRVGSASLAVKVVWSILSRYP